MVNYFSGGVTEYVPSESVHGTRFILNIEERQLLQLI